MRREEQRQKLYFVQMNRDLFRDVRIKRLELTGGSDAVLTYMKVWCETLDTGGVLELKTDMEPAQEIALMIGSNAAPMVASVMTMCQAYGLIRTDEEDKIINFSLTPEYTRAWTRDAIARREKREAERLEAADDVPAIEDKGAEKPKKKPSNKAKAQAAADEMFERLWRQYFKGYKEDKRDVKPATKYKLYKDYGEERCQKALDAYKVSKKVKDGYILQAKNFFNSRIFDYLDGDAGEPDQAQGFAQYMAPPVEEVITDKTVQDAIDENGLYVYGSGYDLAQWEKVKGRYSAAMQAAIERKIKQ